MGMSLKDRMEIDHVIKVDSFGTVTDAGDVYGPEGVYIDADWDKHGDAHVMDWHRKAFFESLGRQGWYAVAPRRAFGSYGDPFLESNESVGGNLEEDIRKTPGYYVAVVVGILAPDDHEKYGKDSNEDPEPYGWMVLRKDLPHVTDYAYAVKQVRKSLELATEGDVIQALALLDEDMHFDNARAEDMLWPDDEERVAVITLRAWRDGNALQSEAVASVLALRDVMESKESMTNG